MGWRICLLMIVAGVFAWALVEVVLPSRDDARIGATANT